MNYKENSIHPFVIGSMLLLVAYLVSPLFSSVHVEGFTAQIESISYLYSINNQYQHDSFYPLVTQFIYETRLLVIQLLALIYKALGNIGDSAFRILTIISFIIWIASSIIFTKNLQFKKLPRLHWFYALLALTLTPGIFELGFYFNDNIVSAAFAVLSLSLLTISISNRILILSALLFSLATLSRIDAVFIAPLLVTMIIIKSENSNKILTSFIIYTISTLTIYVIAWFLTGFTLIDSFIVAQAFILDISYFKNLVVTKFYFLGLLIVIPIFIGIIFFIKKSITEKKSWYAIAGLVVYPIILFIFAPKATETRYIFPLLAPIIAYFGGMGLEFIATVSANKASKHKVLANSFWLIIVLIALLPPLATQFKDGPRSVITGRLWTPMLWKDWQASVDTSFYQIKSKISLLENTPGDHLIISLHYNDEYFTRLSLMQNGYIPNQRNNFSCLGLPYFEKNGQKIYHLRTRPAYGIAPHNQQLSTAIQLISLDKCIGIDRITNTYISDVLYNTNIINSDFFGSYQSENSYKSDVFTFLQKNLTHYGTVSLVSLNKSQLKEALNKSHELLLNSPDYPIKNFNNLIDYYQLKPYVFPHNERTFP
jgi:hypothetical protein